MNSEEYYINNLITDNFQKNIPLSIRETLISLAEDYMKESYPQILSSDYMLFSKTGNRTDFEDIYFKRRHMLNAFILAELSECKGRFLSNITDGIMLICEESGWQLPPHNSYGDGSGNQPLPDISRPVLDLFACETGALLSFAGFLLKDRLDNISPFIYKRIHQEVYNRILLPYHNTFVWWMGNGMDKTCNWTPWCTQNVLISAIFSEVPSETKTIIYNKALKSLNYFINDYGIDGCCDEGALYYRHAGLCLWLSLELLQSQNIDVSQITIQKEKLLNISQYILNMHINGPYYFNFSDCSSKPGPCSAREYLFGKFTGSSSLMAFAAQDVTDSKSYENVIIKDELNLFYRVVSLSNYKEISEYHRQHPFTNVSGDIWYESTGLAITRSKNICLAVKAGHNNDSHNHNDTGSITLFIGGKPCFIDLGVESYTNKTFSSERYSIWTMQSSYHNLPEINNFTQLPGPQYKAENVKLEHFNNNILFTMTMDISHAYDIKTRLSSLKRTVSLDKSLPEVISIEDLFSFNNSEDCSFSPVIIENFMTCERPYFDGNILHIGSLATISFNEISNCTIEEIRITDKRLKQSYSESVYRIRIVVKNNYFKCVLRPLEDSLL